MTEQPVSWGETDEINIQPINGGQVHRALSCDMPWPSCISWRPDQGNTTYREVEIPITCRRCLRHEAYELITAARYQPDKTTAGPSDPDIFRQHVQALVRRGHFDQQAADQIYARYGLTDQIDLP